MAKKYIKSTRYTSARKVTAATYPEDIHPAFSELDNQASKAGYELKVLGNSIEDAEFILKASDDMLPVLNVWLDRSEMNSKGIVYYECISKFPTLDSRKLDFADSAHYYITQWEKVGSFITYLIKESIELDMYEE